LSLISKSDNRHTQNSHNETENNYTNVHKIYTMQHKIITLISSALLDIEDFRFTSF
jgi:hypothetical protein